MRVAEVFLSVQGEGFWTGIPSIFVRVAGCNLRCRYCDTPYASWHCDGEAWSVPELVTQIQRWEGSHVVLTGGEPMLAPELGSLCDRLRQGGYRITIETAGTVYRQLACDLMSISPKLDNSTPNGDNSGIWRQRHERLRHAPEVIGRLLAEHVYQFKFVIGEPRDVRQVLGYLEQFPSIDRDRVMLMPMGTGLAELERVEQWLVESCRTHGLRYCPRRHIEWFGWKRAT